MASPGEWYPFVKSLHAGSVVVSIGGFALRGALMLAGSPLLQSRFVRVAPHIVDTVLLASAAWLAWFLMQYPFVHGWLTAKFIALLAYIALGTLALRRGRTLLVRAVSLAGALAAAGYIVAVALSRDVTPWR
jgi:uncharacterized membrane protein SirB2